MNNTVKDITDRFLAWMLDFIIRKTSNMSIKTRRKLAALLVKIALPFKFCRRDYMLKTIQETLGVDETEAQRIMVRSTEEFVLNCFEMGSLMFMEADEINSKIKVEGLENVEAALSLGKGAIMVSGHFGLWEFIPHWLCLHGYKMSSVARTQNNKYVDDWFKRMRCRHGATVTDSGYAIREIIRGLRQGHIMGLMMDQDNGKAGIFIRFLGKWASAPTGPAVIALKVGCPILPIYLFPDYNGKHLMKAYPPIYTDGFDKGLEGQQKITQIYNDLHEKIIREQPEQWFWLHKRWKTQPSDAPNNPWVAAGLVSLT